MRVNEAEQFVIGGYTIGGRTLDALVFGYTEAKRLMYWALDPQRVHVVAALPVDAKVPAHRNDGLSLDQSAGYDPARETRRAGGAKV